MKVTKCPPGEAIGARDLQRWASRRRAGLSGSGSWGDDDERRWRRGEGLQSDKRWSEWVEIPPPSVARDAVQFERYSATCVAPVVMFGTVSRIGDWLWITPVMSTSANTEAKQLRL
jgi:hypothetical protein